MNNGDFIEKLAKYKLVAVVRGNSAEQAINTVRACFDGGIRLIEITFTVPEAEKIISAVSKEFCGTDLIVGAGTVLNENTAKCAIENGAQFVVSPCLCPPVLEYCVKRTVACSAGILTPTEYVLAVELGSAVVKLFPGDIAKPEGLKALRGPFPNAKIMPTGGVSLHNLEEWFKAGAIAVGAGSNLTEKSKVGDYEGVTAEAVRWVREIDRMMGGK